MPSSKYPAAFDTPVDPENKTLQENTHPELHQEINDIIEAIEQELGLEPSGTFSTVKERIESITHNSAHVILCNGNPKYPAATKGEAYIVTVSGKIGGASGTSVEVGALLVCTETAAEGTQSEVGSYWKIIQGEAAALKAEIESVIASLALKAPLASPALTGVPSAPTASPNTTSTTQLATTAFAQSLFDNAHLAKMMAWPVRRPEEFGAKGDLKVVYDGAITEGTKKVKCATSKPFTEADVGKYLVINSAGTRAKVEGAEPGTKKQWNPLVSRITAFINSEEVELEFEAKHTPAAAAFVAFATDDTKAVREAVEEAMTAAKASGGKCEVWLTKMYGIAGELVTSQGGNAQIPIPLIASTSAGTTAEGQKITLKIFGGPDATALPLWYQHVPQQQAGGTFSFGPRAAAEAKLGSPYAQPELDEAHGRPAVWGGPSPEQGYGTGLKYSNINVVIAGVSTSGPMNSTMTHWELNGSANHIIADGGHSTFAFGIPNLVEETYGESPNEFVLAWAGYEGKFATKKRPAAAIAMPLKGNNDNSQISNHVCEGHTSGIELGEHCQIGALKSVYCVMGGNPGKENWLHPGVIAYWSIEACSFGVYCPPGGEFLLNAVIDTETAGAGRWGFVNKGALWDTEEKWRGVVDLFYGGQANVAIAEHYNGCKKLTIRCWNLPSGPVTLGSGMMAAVPATPITETEYTNLSGRLVSISLKGTIEKLEVDGKELTAAAGNIIVRSLGTIKIKGTGLSWAWNIL